MLAQTLTRLCRPALATATIPTAAFYSIQVLVPSLGESISDGTIATVLKKAGDSVQENETIAQIETDKVTVDIKAPTDGTILGVVVMEQDTVVPGQLVATLDDADAKAKVIGATPPPSGEPAAAQQTPTAAAAAAGPPEPTAAAGRRVPGIRFPPRLTPEGLRVSQLPAEQARAIIQQWQASVDAASAAPAAPAAAAATPAASAGPGAGYGATPAPAAAAAAAPGASSAAVQPSKFASSAVRLDRMPARRELTEKEMELIELGGAM